MTDSRVYYTKICQLIIPIHNILELSGKHKLLEESLTSRPNTINTMYKIT